MGRKVNPKTGWDMPEPGKAITGNCGCGKCGPQSSVNVFGNDAKGLVAIQIQQGDDGGAVVLGTVTARIVLEELKRVLERVELVEAARAFGPSVN